MKLISVFLKANEANLNAPLGPILSQYDYDFKQFIIEFNEITKDFILFDFYFFVYIFLLKKKNISFLCKFPQTSFFLFFFSFEKKIKKTDLYNISKIKCTFNFVNIKILYKIILANCRNLNLKIINE